MNKQTLKILQQMLQNFYGVFDIFGNTRHFRVNNILVRHFQVSPKLKKIETIKGPSLFNTGQSIQEWTK